MEGPVQTALPSTLGLLQIPLKFLDTKVVKHGDNTHTQVLTVWSGCAPEDATLENIEDLRSRFSAAPAWGQAGFRGEAIVRIPALTQEDDEAQAAGDQGDSQGVPDQLQYDGDEVRTAGPAAHMIEENKKKRAEAEEKTRSDLVKLKAALESRIPKKLLKGHSFQNEFKLLPLGSYHAIVGMDCKCRRTFVDVLVCTWSASSGNVDSTKDAANMDGALEVDLNKYILKCQSVYKCKLCPRIICLNEEMVRVHLKSKRHARSKKLLGEGRLKLMLIAEQ
uniref:Uncharacterized protein n=1 Tax=Oryza brachyantha TaxID=4533 RepID=J3N640_ORYBR